MKNASALLVIGLAITGGSLIAGERRPLTPEQVGLVRAWIDQGAK